ncbi:hypothetical protein [Peribacillus sp. SCS-155]|uniref:hypothetical protein n=1 Tax=Peribacillus sedimenti TaxID=3115297 RepID=UPI0039058093
MLTYRFNEDELYIKEIENGNDVEFNIQFPPQSTLMEELKKIERHFDDNRVHTDVLFYVYPNHEYRVIVRHDYYTDFVLALMKHRLLQSVEWKP